MTVVKDSMHRPIYAVRLSVLIYPQSQPPRFHDEIFIPVALNALRLMPPLRCGTDLKHLMLYQMEQLSKARRLNESRRRGRRSLSPINGRDWFASIIETWDAHNINSFSGPLSGRDSLSHRNSQRQPILKGSFSAVRD